MKYKLNKAITAHDAEINELNLREPTGKDVQELGFPYLLIMQDDQEAVQIQAKVIGKYIVRLAGIPPSAVDTISPSDFNGLVGVMMGFFGVQAAA